MTGFATVDAAIAVARSGKLQRVPYSKTMAAVAVVNIPYTLWRATGYPTVGVATTKGVANGRANSKTTQGALDINDAASGELSFLASFGSNTASTGTLILCDRMAECNLDASEANGGTIVGLDASARMAATTAPGDGGQIWCEVTTAFVGTSSITFEATDQLGTTAQAQQVITETSGAVIERSVNSQLWQGLAAGTTGVRALTKSNLTVAGGATGAFSACIVRPLGYITLPISGQFIERDFICELPSAPRIWDNACLFMIWIPTATTALTLFGELRIIAG